METMYSVHTNDRILYTGYNYFMATRYFASAVAVQGFTRVELRAAEKIIKTYQKKC